MQENKLNVLIKFILNNSNNKKKIIDRIEIDSRKIKKGQVFLSLDENKYKNLKNIEHAIINKASAIVTLFPFTRKNIKTIIPILVIRDLRNIYYKLYSSIIKKYNYKFKTIGITGTNGKTSTSLLLANALSNTKKKIGVISSEGIGIYPILKISGYTTPTIDTIYKSFDKFLKNNCDYIIIECSSQGLHQGRLQGILFDYSLITNISSDHLDYHKTLESYIKSKLIILNQSKTAILNYDSPILKKINHSKYKKTKFKYISINQKKSKIIKNKNIIHNQEAFEIFHPSSILFIKSIMQSEGFKDYNIKKSLSNLKVISGRRNIIYTKNKGTYIIDYAHTSQSYIDIFKDFQTKKSITTLFGCGGDRDKNKRKIIGKIVDKHSTHIFITEDNSRTEGFISIANDILEGINNKSKYIIEKSRKRALKRLFNQSKGNDVNFILGKGSENYIIKGKKKIKHNDTNYLMEMIKKI